MQPVCVLLALFFQPGFSQQDQITSSCVFSLIQWLFFVDVCLKQLQAVPFFNSLRMRPLLSLPCWSPLLRSNQQIIILGTPLFYRVSCISQYALGTQSSEQAVEYMGGFFFFLSPMCLFEIKVKQKTRAYIIVYISNRKIKYKEKYASWTELC